MAASGFVPKEERGGGVSREVDRVGRSSKERYGRYIKFGTSRVTVFGSRSHGTAELAAGVIYGSRGGRAA